MIPQASSKLSKYLALDKNLYDYKKTVENYLESYLVSHEVPEDIWKDVIEVQYRAYTETKDARKSQEEAEYGAFKRRRSAICTFLKGI
jgi:hypothetical protein